MKRSITTLRKGRSARGLSVLTKIHLVVLALALLSVFCITTYFRGVENILVRSTLTLPQDINPATKYYYINHLIWDSKGCQKWSHPNLHLSPDNSTTALSLTPAQSTNIAQRQIEKSSTSTGIAISLAKAVSKFGPGMLNLLCQKLPTQQAYFYEPQNIDLLLLIGIEGVTYQEVADCLELNAASPSNSRTWHNLDGSNLTTYEYRSKRGRTHVYLAPFSMSYPEYIQQNASKLLEARNMEGCNRYDNAEDYVQGTRWYTSDALQLGILQRYDYFLKVDLDIEFNKSSVLSFDILNDMKIRGALFGHTGKTADSSCDCTLFCRFTHRVLGPTLRFRRIYP